MKTWTIKKEIYKNHKVKNRIMRRETIFLSESNTEDKLIYDHSNATSNNFVESKYYLEPKSEFSPIPYLTFFIP